MTTTSNIRNSELKIMAVVATFIGFGFGYLTGHSDMKVECGQIITARLPVPPVPIIYLSREE